MNRQTAGDFRSERAWATHVCSMKGNGDIFRLSRTPVAASNQCKTVTLARRQATHPWTGTTPDALRYQLTDDMSHARRTNRRQFLSGALAVEAWEI